MGHFQAFTPSITPGPYPSVPIDLICQKSPSTKIGTAKRKVPFTLTMVTPAPGDITNAVAIDEITKPSSISV